MPSCDGGTVRPSRMGVPTSLNDQYWKPAGRARSSWPVLWSAAGEIGPYEPPGAVVGEAPAGWAANACNGPDSAKPPAPAAAVFRNVRRSTVLMDSSAHYVVAGAK